MANAGLEKAAVVVGNVDKIELWNPEMHQSFYDETRQKFHDMAQTIL
jgi:DNA-binding transcriptional regulator/RsmH inhibitor MraZ